MSYDSTEDTTKHINRVRELLTQVEQKLSHRGFVHDYSKLHEPEKSAFDRLTPKLKGLTYGSDEYRASLKELGVALGHHYAKNRHHPEHFCIMTVDYDDGRKQYTVLNELLEEGFGIRSMTLLDLVEMLMDWKAASERHENGDIVASIHQNQKRFGYSDELAAILMNTVHEMGWTK